MTTLENFYFGNINPSSSLAELGRHIRLVCLDLMTRLLLSLQSRLRGDPAEQGYQEKLSEMIGLLDEVKSFLTEEQQREILEQIDNCQLTLISLSERDAYLEGFKMGARMMIEVIS